MRVELEFYRLLRFVLTGGLVTLSSFGVFVALLRGLLLPVIVAYAAAYAFGVLLGYFVNSVWTFDRKQPRSLPQLLAYAGVHVFILFVSAWLLEIEVSRWHWTPEVGALVNAAPNAILGYVLMRTFVFGKLFARH